MTSKAEIHEINWRTLRNAVIGIPAMVVIIGLTMNGLDHAFYRLAPDRWFHIYDAVKWYKGDDGYLYFNSYRSPDGDVLTGGTDALHCLTADDLRFSHYSAAEWGPTLLGKDDTETSWRYPEAYPPLTSCRLVSKVWYLPHPDYKKWQIIVGDVFTTPGRSQ